MYLKLEISIHKVFINICHVLGIFIENVAAKLPQEYVYDGVSSLHREV